MPPGVRGDTMTERDFLHAISDEPDEPAHYLVYADWLEEQGQAPRGRLIRARLEQERTQGYSPHWEGLSRQARQLEAEVKDNWPAYRQWQEVLPFSYWRRGLPSRARLPREKVVTAEDLRSLPSF